MNHSTHSRRKGKKVAPIPAAFIRMKDAAKRDGRMKFHTLTHQMRCDLFKVAYDRLSGKKACGLDGVDKKGYGRDLETNLKALEDRIHSGEYRPAPSREVLIPKANGKTRPLAVSNLEDKIVQKSVSMILETLFEPLFVQRSLGFRPKRGAHQAIRTVYHLLKGDERPYVVECDMEKFFDSVDHELLMEYLRRRIGDPRFLKLIERLLKTRVKEASGKIRKNERGTPQGSIVSPILANIYLHYALDTWFEKNYKSPYQCEVRYADDVFFCFRKMEKAKSFYRSLKSRLKEVGLSLNDEKSGIVDFRRCSKQVFDLPGFTFYWGKDGKRRDMLKVRTQTEKMRQSLKEFKEWIRANRNRYDLKTLWIKACQKLRGHYAYFSVEFNQRTSRFYNLCIRILYKWLNRRSQKRSFSWENFKRRLRNHPLPKPWGKEAFELTQEVFAFTV